MLTKLGLTQKIPTRGGVNYKAREKKSLVWLTEVKKVSILAGLYMSTEVRINSLFKW